MYEKGIISKDDIGRDLPFGDAEGIVELTRWNLEELLKIKYKRV